MARAKGKTRKIVAAASPALPHPSVAFAIAVLAIIAFVVLAFGNITATSPVTDETVHLVAGYRYLTTHDYRLNPEHPPLLKMLAAIPLRTMTIWPDVGSADGSMTRALLDESWAMAVANPMAEWTYAHHLLYGVRDDTLHRLGGNVPSTAALQRSDFLNDAAAMFTRARTAMLLSGILLAAAIFFWSLEAWGAWAAALSTLLFCFDPNFIAHSGLVTTDVGVTLLMFATVWLFWRVCRKFSWPNVAAFAICFGLAQTAKFSALLLAPMIVVIALLHGWRQLPRLALVIGIAFLTAFVVIWAVYGFRFSMAVNPADGHPPIRQLVDEAGGDLLGRSILFAADAHLLPEAYLHGLANVRASTISRNSFLRGQYSTSGFGDYFLWTFLYKTSLPGIAAILIALVVSIRKRPAGLLPFLIWPIAIYLFVSVRSNINIGHRHILPVYPFLYVLCGSLAKPWERFASLRRAVTAVAAIALIVASSLFVFTGMPAPMWSKHLSYLNEFAGGPERGFTKLVDSNFDWGQDLPRLSAWLREHEVNDPIDLVYTGTADPRYYSIRHHNLALAYFAEPQLPADVVPPAAYFAIGATAYEGAPFAADSRDLWRSYLTKNHATLAGKAGYSMFIYRLEQRKLPPL